MKELRGVDGAPSGQLVEVTLGRRQYVVKVQDAEDFRLTPSSLGSSSGDRSKAVLCDNVVIGSVGISWTRADLVHLVQDHMRTCIAATDPWNRLVNVLLATHPNALVTVDYSAAHYLLAIAVPFASTNTTMHIRMHADIRIHDACVEYSCNEGSLTVILDTPRDIQDALDVVERQRLCRIAFLDAMSHQLLVLSFDAVHHGSFDCAIVHDKMEVCWIDVVRVTFAPTWGLPSSQAIQAAHQAAGIPYLSIVLIDASGEYPIEIATAEMNSFYAMLIAVPATAASFSSWLRRVLIQRHERHSPID
ncbi:hypothetical protein H310_02266 [Aphanomyces invadans]|uniref:Uncharacterized protein n=1 Tax=Aphanomyces invadans TaxID=157072 RepID=A0A024UNG9_9STRA|nr:hypothetical protein H310_02266 [Aphanomyces invadans]ETW07844.1 hypothetical protein H310_02266 [Aphanomyces invadans]|eukprot:XP_008863937.1 hypothetical protein H310_02266 [Aphanomyces invadans]